MAIRSWYDGPHIVTELVVRDGTVFTIAESSRRTPPTNRANRPETPSESSAQAAYGDIIPLRRFGDIFPVRQNGALFDAVVIRSWYDGDLLVVKCGMRHDGSIRHMTCSKFVGYEVPSSARPTRYS